MKHRLTRITTRTGDSGTSGLADGSRLAKSEPVFIAMGDIDELNSVLGIVVTSVADEAIRVDLLAIQSRLFDLGATMAVPGTNADMAVEIEALEKITADYNAQLSPLTNFVLPGGSATAAHIHLARAVCRRAERSYWSFLEQQSAADTSGGIFLNRLSDHLFVLARIVNVRASHPEIIWQPRSRSQ